MAVGGLIGTALVGRLRQRFGTSTLLKAGLLIELGTHLTLALTSTWAVAASALLIFGIHGSVWSVLTVSLRQHRTTDEVRGRVMSAYMVLSVGGAAIGSLARRSAGGGRDDHHADVVRHGRRGRRVRRRRPVAAC